METEAIRQTIKDWISFDDEERKLRTQIKELHKKKAEHSAQILQFMKSNEVDNFALEGNGVGNISRSVRTSRPALKRSQIRTQLLLQFADQPQRAAEALRAIEGIPEGEDNMSVGGTQRELLVRRLPKVKNTVGLAIN
jgi:seryl-tRNA synthetase